MTAREIEAMVKETGFMPLFSHTDITVCSGVLKSCYDAGVRLFEFTNRNENSFDVFYALRIFCNDHLPEMVLGIGTIKNAQQAEQYIAAGADFLISPMILKEIHDVAVKHKKLWIPGCATPSEIGLAENWERNTVKIFPAKQLGGAAYIKAVKAVFPSIQFMATGGVEPVPEDLSAWFNSGVSAVGIGSQLFPAAWLANAQFDLITTHIQTIMRYIRQAKG